MVNFKNGEVVNFLLVYAILVPGNFFLIKLELGVITHALAAFMLFIPLFPLIKYLNKPNHINIWMKQRASGLLLTFTIVILIGGLIVYNIGLI